MSRRNYKTISETGPDWTPIGVPSMSVQIIPISYQQGYASLTHGDINVSSNYFNVIDAYLVNDIKNENGYEYKKRSCDGSFVQ
jgi:hypothetical protein